MTIPSAPQDHRGGRPGTVVPRGLTVRCQDAPAAYDVWPCPGGVPRQTADAPRPTLQSRGTLSTTVPPLPPPTEAGRRCRVAMFVANDVSNDARVLREATALAGAGYLVRVYGWASARRPPGIEVTNGVEIVRHRFHRTTRSDAGASPDAVRTETGTETSAVRRRISPAVRHGVRRAGVLAAMAVSIPAAAALLLFRSLVARLPVVSAGAEPRGGSLVLPASLRFARWFHESASSAVAWSADIAHGHDLNALPAAELTRRRGGARMVYDSHELWLGRNRSTRVSRAGGFGDRIVERSLVARSDLVITVAPGIARWLADRYDLTDDRVAVVRNVPDDRECAQPVAALRSRAGLTPEDKVLVYVGRVTTGRGLLRTLDAMVLLPKNVHLVLLGYRDPTFGELFDARVAETGLADRVHQLAPVPPSCVPHAIRDADVSQCLIEPVCLSYEHALPNKLFESLRAGVPIVAADLPEIAAVVKEFRAGTLVPADADARRLAMAITTLLEDPPTPHPADGLTWRSESRVLLEAYSRLGGARPHRRTR